jgi:uncharacterized membrane protein (DUF2068 family)
LKRKTSKAKPRASGRLLVWIGIYKVLEGSLLLAAGFGVLRLLHGDVEAHLRHWVHVLRVDPDNKYIHGFLERAFSISPKQLKELSIGTFIYAALRYAEGFGLAFRKKWAEYLTVIATGLFIPLEIFEMTHHLTYVKVLVFLTNVAVLVYLIVGLRKDAKARPTP